MNRKTFKYTKLYVKRHYRTRIVSFYILGDSVLQKCNYNEQNYKHDHITYICIFYIAYRIKI